MLAALSVDDHHEPPFLSSLPFPVDLSPGEMALVNRQHPQDKPIWQPPGTKETRKQIKQAAEHFEQMELGKKQEEITKALEECRDAIYKQVFLFLSTKLWSFCVHSYHPLANVYTPLA